MRGGIWTALMVLGMTPGLRAVAQTPNSAAKSLTKTEVVILGTGTPQPNPDTSGPAVAIVVNGAAYLVDCGPGVVRRAAAAERKGIAALNVQNIKTVFLTHLHSDHTLGYPDLIFTPWVMGRKEPLEAYGPRGLQSMTEHIERVWERRCAQRSQSEPIRQVIRCTCRRLSREWSIRTRM